MKRLGSKISLSSCFIKTPSSLSLAVCWQLFLFHDYLITLNDPFVIRSVHSYNVDSFIFDLRKFYDCLFWVELVNLVMKATWTKGIKLGDGNNKSIDPASSDWTAVRFFRLKEIGGADDFCTECVNRYQLLNLSTFSVTFPCLGCWHV